VLLNGIEVYIMAGPGQGIPYGCADGAGTGKDNICLLFVQNQLLIIQPDVQI